MCQDSVFYTRRYERIGFSRMFNASSHWWRSNAGAPWGAEGLDYSFSDSLGLTLEGAAGNSHTYSVLGGLFYRFSRGRVRAQRRVAEEIHELPRKSPAIEIPLTLLCKILSRVPLIMERFSGVRRVKTSPLSKETDRVIEGFHTAWVNR